MNSYKILNHTADLKIQVWGKDIKELFRNAFRGMMDYLKKDFNPPKTKKLSRIIKISSLDLNTLLVDFLSEVLTLADTHQEIYREVEFINFPHLIANSIKKENKELFLEARLFGFKINQFDRDIKAVTYHQLNIKKNQKGFWEAVILFDI